ncbi:MAG: ketopantoate reductase family protein, partial [Candidatus Rokuibacteriota bacterium]
GELGQVREPFEAVFVAVKAYDTEWATQLAVDHLSRRRDSPRARRLAEIMSEVAPAEVTTNLWGERWSKLALNCMLNPLAGLSGLGTAEVRSDKVARRVAAHIGAEVVRVGSALGHRIEPILGIAARRFGEAADTGAIETLCREIAADAQSRSGGRPSMLQDVMKGRRTEIDYLNGFVAAEGRKVGIPTPFNDAVVDAFHARGVGRVEPDPRNLDPLVRLLS